MGRREMTHVLVALAVANGQVVVMEMVLTAGYGVSQRE